MSKKRKAKEVKIKSKSRNSNGPVSVKSLQSFLEVTKRKKKAHSYSTKQNIILDYDEGMINKQICDKYNMQHSTVTNIIKNREKIMSVDVKIENKTRLRPPNNPYLENDSNEYETNSRNSNDPLSQDIIQESVKSFTEDSKRKIQAYSYSLKQDIILDYDQGMTNKQICDKYQMKHSTVSNIIKNRGKIMSVDAKMRKKRRIKPPLKLPKRPDVEHNSHGNVSEFRDSNDPMPEKLIQESEDKKRKLQAYSYSLKQEIILNYDEGMTNKQICKKYDINHSTVSNIFKSRAKIMSVDRKMKKKRRLRPYIDPDLKNDSVGDLSKCQNPNVSVSGKPNQESVKGFSEDSKRKTQAYSYSLKQEIILDYDQGMTNKRISEKYDIPHSTVSNIIKNKEKIMSVDGKMRKKRRLRPPKQPDLENDSDEYVTNFLNVPEFVESLVDDTNIFEPPKVFSALDTINDELLQLNEVPSDINIAFSTLKKFFSQLLYE